MFEFVLRSLCLARGRNCLPNGVGPARPRLPHSMPRVLQTRVPRIGLAQFAKTDPSLRRRGFITPDDFFRKIIEAKGWRALCQPPRPAAMSVVREFYANLASHVLKKVRVRGVLVDFSAESINSYYGLEHIPPGPFDQPREHPDYPEVIRVLTNGRGEWRINSAGHAVNFKAKHLAYIPKVWHHFITSRLIPMTNVCEVTA